MTEAEVRGRITVFADGDTEPALTSEDLDILVSMCKVVDVNGVIPGDDAWTPSYNVNYGIAQAWLLKATRLANRYLFMSGGKMLSRQQYYEHCMELHKKFASKAGIQAVRLAPQELVGVVPNNWNY